MNSTACYVVIRLLCFLQLGQYSNGTHCVDCPAGYRCPAPDQNPQECPDGYYQDTEGNAVCKACPGGQSCLNKDMAPVNCQGGFYSLTGEMTCTVSKLYNSCSKFIINGFSCCY